jgi:hypothetical protein
VRPYLEKRFTKIGLVEWLKVKALSLSPSTEKKRKENLPTKHDTLSSNPSTNQKEAGCRGSHL